MENNNKKIMLIEDDEFLINNIKDILTEEGYFIEVAKDGLSGIDSIRKLKPDLILCDISMPQMDGYQVLEEVSKDAEIKNTPFIFLTAKTKNTDIRKGMSLGADDYIFKPFDIDDLLNSIRIRLQRRHEQQQPVKIETPLKTKDKIMLRCGKKIEVILTNDIKYISAETPYVMIKFINGKSDLRRGSLDEWEEKLSSNNFVRIHRSTLINIDHLLKIEKTNYSISKVWLKDEVAPFSVSKRSRKYVKELLL